MKNILPLFSLIIFANITCTSYSIKRYPDQFPPEIVSKTSNLEFIISNYETSIEDSLKKSNELQNHDKRPSESIMKTVMQNLAALRYAYNKRLRENRLLYGKITVKYSILENGKVNSAEIISSTINDTFLENTIKNKIKNWKFDSLSVTADTTTIIYPFVFMSSQTENDIWKKDFEQNKKGDRSSDDLLKGWLKCKEAIQGYFDDYSNQSGKKKGQFSVFIAISKKGYIEELKITNSTIESKETVFKLLKIIRAFTFPNCLECNENTIINYSFGYFRHDKKKISDPARE